MNHPSTFTKNHLSILQKITNFLIGFFLALFIVGASLKLMSSILGLLLGSIIAAGGGFTLIKKTSSMTKKGIGIGMLSSSGFMLLLGIIFLVLLYTVFQQALS